MSPQQFIDLYQCPVAGSPLLRQVAEQYVRDIEAYDRAVCTGPVMHGSVMPATPRERALISRNARATFDRLAIQHCQHFSRAELRREIGRVDP